MAFGSYTTLLPPTTTAANGQATAAGDFGPSKTIRAQLNVTAASGTTPTLTAYIEDTVDGGANWNQVAAFTAATAPGVQTINVTTPFSDTLRVRWTVGGTTPSFTFTIAAYLE